MSNLGWITLFAWNLYLNRLISWLIFRLPLLPFFQIIMRKLLLVHSFWGTVITLSKNTRNILYLIWLYVSSLHRIVYTLWVGWSRIALQRLLLLTFYFCIRPEENNAHVTRFLYTLRLLEISFSWLFLQVCSSWSYEFIINIYNFCLHGYVLLLVLNFGLNGILDWCILDGFVHIRIYPFFVNFVLL